MRCLFLVGAIALLIGGCQANGEDLSNLTLLEGDRGNGECSFPHPYEFEGGKDAIETFARLEPGDSTGELPKDHISEIGEGYIGDGVYLYYEYTFPHPNEEAKMYASARTQNEVLVNLVKTVTVGTLDNACYWSIRG